MGICFGSSLPSPSPTPQLTPSPTPQPTPPRVETPPPEPRVETPPPEPRVETPLPPDQAEVKYDKAEDKKVINSSEEDYHNPSPPTNTDGIKEKDKFYDDEEFNKASDDAELFETASDAVSLTSYNMDAKESKNQQTKPRATKGLTKMSFAEVDSHAQNMDAKAMDTIKDLTEYLKKPWKGDKHEQIKTARAIVTWLSQQDLTIDYGDETPNTPCGLLQMIKNEHMTYATCFTLLCRAAGLQCSLIEGYVKAARYEPGNKDVPSTKWTAVYGECGWQIVHPYWICRALYGHNMGGWIKVEADGTRVRQREQSSDGVVRNTFQERYFMPKPEEFVYECCANDTAWQLVKPDKEIKSKEEFLKIPYLLPPFHSLGLQIVSEQKCELKSKDGFCKIEFKGRTTNSHLLLLQYELFKKDSGGDELDNDDVSRMVFNSRSNEHFIFDIRFPVEGVYKLVIYGGPYKSAALRLCEFKIVCDKRMNKEFELLPLDCNEIGWGPSPVTMEAGLLMPSKPNGLVSVNKSGPTKLQTEIKFRIRDDFISKHEYSAAVHGRRGNKLEKIDGSDFVVTKGEIRKTTNVSVSITTQLELVVKVTLPGEGEFGITIHERETQSVKTTTVCNYLATTLAYKGTFYKANVTNAKKALAAACEESVSLGQEMAKKIEDIESALNKCMKQNILKSDEDVCVAETTLEYLKCRNLLYQTHMRDNYGVTLKTLAIMDRYRNRAALQKEIKRVEALGDQQRQRLVEARVRNMQ